MATQRDDLKIFISWSGTLAKEVTKVLREWLPKMFDNIDPWASETDIDAGARGLGAIEARLNESRFGIIVVTTQNFERPWLNFEAGALSKRLDGDINRVVPLLVNFDDVDQLLLSPMHQFQRVKLNKDGAQRLCMSIATTIGLDTQVINHRFEFLWDDLEQRIKQAIEAAGDQPPPPKLDPDEVLKQLTSVTSDLQRIARRNDVPQSSFLDRLVPIRRKEPHELDLDAEPVKEILRGIREIAERYRPVADIRPGPGCWNIVLEGEQLAPDEFEALSSEFSETGYTFNIGRRV